MYNSHRAARLDPWHPNYPFGVTSDIGWWKWVIVHTRVEPLQLLQEFNYLSLVSWSQVILFTRIHVNVVYTWVLIRDARELSPLRSTAYVGGWLPVVPLVHLQQVQVTTFVQLKRYCQTSSGVAIWEFSLNPVVRVRDE